MMGLKLESDIAGFLRQPLGAAFFATRGFGAPEALDPGQRRFATSASPSAWIFSRVSGANGCFGGGEANWMTLGVFACC